MNLPQLKLEPSQTVSVVVVSWNTRDVLRDCLQSVFAHSDRLLLEVIVSDNDSLDGTAEMVRQEFPKVVLIENQRNLGFAAANNVGIRRARGQYILLLNPDTIILDGAIEKAIQYADAHPSVGVLGCRVLEAEGVVQRTCFSFPTPLNTLLTEFGFARLFPRSRICNRAELGWWDRDTERTVDVVSGMFMLVRREALRQVGNFDEEYFVFAEEADLCFRMWKAGWPCVFTPIASIIHREGGGKSTRQVSARMFVQLQKSLLIFHRKNWGYSSYLQLKVIYIISMMIRAPLYLTLGAMCRSPVWKSRAVAAWTALKYHTLGVDSADLASSSPTAATRDDGTSLSSNAAVLQTSRV